MTTYAATAPIIVLHPQSQTNTPSQTVTFTVVAGGSAPLSLPMVFQHQYADGQCHERDFDPGQCSSHQRRHLFRDGDQHGRFSHQLQCRPHRVVGRAVPAANVGLYLQQRRDFSLTVNGDTGPDYIVLASTNLTDWTSIFTNHSPTPPFVWTDSGASNFSQRFYRIQLGP